MHAQDRVLRSGLDGDLAVVALDHDAPGDVKAEAGALADILGRVEGLEGAGLHTGRHARAAVADVDDDVLGLDAGRDVQRSLPLHGVGLATPSPSLPAAAPRAGWHGSAR